MIRAACAALTAMAFVPKASAQQDLTELSFEELLSADITSVAKRPQKVDEAAAAVAVLGQADIRRTGATTLPELLRYIPGVEVAEIDASNSAVSARGFNWRFSNKLLVLIDGRAVYQSVLSGLFWDAQLVPVEDIDRIEVIRGPGATLYGANAVNGVINVVTKHAADTLGGLLAAQGGVTTRSEQFAGRFHARQGFRVGESGAVRLYVTGRDLAALVDADGDPYNEGAKAVQGGFRFDWEPNGSDAFTLQGDVRRLDFETSLLFDLQVGPGRIQERTTDESGEGENILGRWSRSFSQDNRLTVQSYYDHNRRTEFDATFDTKTIDLDISHYFSWGERFETLWGLGYRYNQDEVIGNSIFVYQQPELQTDLFSGFLQQDAKFLRDRLRVSIGSKFEHNDFTGFEVQPSVRAIWVDEKDWSLWGAVSRAVRTPSRFETSLDFDFGRTPPDPENGIFLPVDSALRGNPALQAEDLLAVELGWRKTWANGISVDLAAYHNDYSELVVFEFDDPVVLTGPFGPDGIEVPFLIEQNLAIQNGREADIVGLEGAVQWPISEWWDFRIAGDVRDISFDDDLESADVGILQSFSGLSPDYQVLVRNDIQLSSRAMTTVTGRRVSGLRGSSTEAYTDLDIRLAYRPRPSVEIGLLGENLVTGSRAEFSSALYPAPFGEVERRVSASLSVRF